MITVFQDPLPFMHSLEPPRLLVRQLFWVHLDCIHIVLVTFLGVLLATHVLPLLEVICLMMKVANHTEVSPMAILTPTHWMVEATMGALTHSVKHSWQAH